MMASISLWDSSSLYLWARAFFLRNVSILLLPFKKRVKSRSRYKASSLNQTKMNRPGLQFWAYPIDTVNTRIRPFNHVFHPLGKPEWEPRSNELYVICKDGTIQSVYDPGLPIAWELVDEDGAWFYRVNAPGQGLRACLVRYHATCEEPPEGRGRIEAEYVCPDAPEKAKIDKIGERLGETMADCCAALNDPVQTDAMLKFAEGQLSYAEMRALCG